MNEINRRDVDYAWLLDLDVLTAWTMDRQRVHHQDAAAYEEILATFQAALRSEVVEGDGRWSAARRARKVEKHLKAAIKAARAQEGAMEAFRLAAAAHKAHVQALPAQRVRAREAAPAPVMMNGTSCARSQPWRPPASRTGTSLGPIGCRRRPLGTGRSAARSYGTTTARRFWRPSSRLSRPWTTWTTSRPGPPAQPWRQSSDEHPAPKVR